MKKHIWIIVAIIALIIIDQATKMYMLDWVTRGAVPLFGPAFDVAPNAYLMARVTSFFNLVFTWNPGVAFSMLHGLGYAMPLALIAITGAVIGYFGHALFARATDRWERIALTLIVGGALGNLIDRIRFGAVIDFLDFHAFGWHWPAFNFADIFIVVGVFIYVWIILKRK